MEPRSSYTCVVIGAGPAGLAAAGCLAALGLDVAIAAAEPPRRHGTASAIRQETRTAALFPCAIKLLDALGAWRELAEVNAPVLGIRLVDGSRRLVRAPEVVFHARDIDHDNLGFNVPNAELVQALSEAAARLGVTMLPDGRVLAVQHSESHAAIELSEGRTISAQLLIAADGRNSLARSTAGIDVQTWRYDQAALACRFSHSRTHGGMSTEIHAARGPCTTIPLPGNSSSLVWMDEPARIEQLCAAPGQEFLGALSGRLGGLLGALSDVGPRRGFELTGLVAEPLARARVALVGEAAHAMPPIGAQGLNLGLTDCAVLADIVAAAHRQGQDIGAPEVLEAYTRARSVDVQRRIGAVDMLNRSLKPEFLPLGFARGAGLHVLAAMPSLRRRLMLEGLYPPEPLPSLMRTTTA